MGYLLAHNKVVNDTKIINKSYALYQLETFIKLKYIINNYYIRIHYCFNYPNKSPNVYINNTSLINIYNYLIKNNSEYINSSIINNSLVLNKWNKNYNTLDINNEIEYVIRLIKFNTEKIFLKKIIDKFSNESMDYLYNYLIYV